MRLLWLPSWPPCNVVWSPSLTFSLFKSLSNFNFCLSKVLRCWCSLSTYINSLHLSTSLSWFIHVSLKSLTMFRVLLIDLILLFIKALSALLTIWRPLGVLIFLCRHILTGTSPLERHLRVNLLWLAKSAIFLSYFSHCRKIFTLSLPYSVLVSKHQNWFCFREISILHYDKQNEKHPYEKKCIFIFSMIKISCMLKGIITVTLLKL